MRFASLQSSGNGSKYAAAGKAVVDSSANIFDVQRKTGPDYAGLSKVAMKTASDEKISGMKAEAYVAKRGIEVFSDVKRTQIGIERDRAVRNAKSSGRKAGILPAIGKIAAAGFLSASDNTKDRKYPTADRKGFDDKYKSDVTKLLADNKAQRESIYAESDATSEALRNKFKPSTEAPSIDSTDSTNVAPVNEDKPGKVTTGGVDSSTKSVSLNPKNNPLAGLTSKDYDDMAFTISSEAALGTDDVYGVGANLVTRLRNGGYGDTIHAISHAPGQYEGVYTGRSVASPKISAQLQSPEGQKKLIEAFNRLDGRTEFKGQTMIHNRVPSEDPMFSPNGNFFHYAGQ